MDRQIVLTCAMLVGCARSAALDGSEGGVVELDAAVAVDAESPAVEDARPAARDSGPPPKDSGGSSEFADSGRPPDGGRVDGGPPDGTRVFRTGMSTLDNWVVGLALPKLTTKSASTPLGVPLAWGVLDAMQEPLSEPSRRNCS